MPPIQFARESLTDELWSESLPLLIEHWREISHFQDIPLNPDRALYAAAESQSLVRVFTARVQRHWRGDPISRLVGDAASGRSTVVFEGYECSDSVPTSEIDGGDLAGYALFFVRPNPHYAQSLQAAQDVIYVAPWARGRTGYRFIAFCDEQLRAEGVQVVRHHVKAAHNFGTLLERQGYEVEDVIYTKRLDLPTIVPAVAAAMAVREVQATGSFDPGKWNGCTAWDGE